LEVLRVLKEAELTLPVHLEAIDFTDTEGVLFELLGSSALAGTLPISNPDNTLEDEKELLARLEEAGLIKDQLLKARRNPDWLAGFIELHIEQGTRLSDSGHQIGVGANIAGDCSYKFIYHGRADMSASTPMKDRQDASVGASAITLAISQLVKNNFPGCAANVNNIQLLPGTIDLIPTTSEITLKFWAPDEHMLKHLENAILQEGYSQADKYGLELETKLLHKHSPMSFSLQFQKAINRAAQTLGLSYTSIASKANHDGQSLNHICPTSMIFIPSVKGVSHSFKEFSHWSDCINGANVLLQSILNFVTLMTSDE
jgi:hydantoinase/carbamoylase family amidase